jgi:hypothetical protein
MPNHLHEDGFPLDCVENEMVTRTLSLKAKVSYSLSLGVAWVNNAWLGITWPSITFWSIFSGRGVGCEHNKHNVYCYIIPWILKNIVRSSQCAPTVKRKVLESDKTLFTYVKSTCSNILAELAFMSVKTATLNKIYSNYKQALQFNWEYENFQVKKLPFRLKYMAMYLLNRCWLILAHNRWDYYTAHTLQSLIIIFQPCVHN